MDKLQELQQKITDFQAKSAAKEEIKAFIAIVTTFLKKSKEEFESLSSENMSQIEEAISAIETKKSEILSDVNNTTSRAVKDFDNRLNEVKSLLEDLKSIEVRDGVDGKDADEEKIIDEVLNKIPKSQEIVLDNGEKIVEKINSITDGGVKIDASHIKNLPQVTQQIIERVGFPETQIKPGANVSVRKDASGSWVISADATGGGGNAAGADTQVQFNDAGVLNGDSTFTFNKTTNVLTVDGLTLTGTLTLPDNIRQTFNPGATVAGLNVGSLAGDPSTPINGDLWYDSSANELTARINGANVALGSGGGASAFTGLTDTFASYTGFAYNFVRVNPLETALEPFTLRNREIIIGNASDQPEAVGVSGDVTIANDGTVTISSGAVDIAMLSATGTPSASNFLRGDNTWATPAGSGTVTATGGALTSNSVVLGAGTTDTKVVAGITTDGTSQLNLGVNATTLGKLKLFGNTSGDVTLQPNAVAGTGIVLTLPATTGTVALTSQIPSLTGYVNTTGTPANNQIAIFTDADTVEGDSSLTYDGTSFNLATAKNFQIAGTTILADTTGTTTLSNIDAIDATTEATIEAAIDTLANLTSIQGRTVTLSDAGFDVLAGWDDSASAYKNFLLADILTEASPATGDFLLLYGAEGDLRKVNWSSLPSGSGGTLDSAYDFGGAGAGRSITADSGAVEITVPDTENTPALILNQNDVTNSPAALRIIQNPTYSATDGYPIEYVTTNAGGNGFFVEFYQNSTSPVAGDYIGGEDFFGNSSTGAKVPYAYFNAVIVSTTNGSHYGSLNVSTAVNGTTAEMLEIGAESGTAINGIGVGTISAAGVVSSRGSQDLILQTGNATTGNITIVDGANGEIQVTPNGSGALAVKGNSTQGGELRLYEDSDNGTNYTAVKPTQSLSANNTLNLPATNGTVNVGLTATTGSGQTTTSATYVDVTNLQVTLEASTSYQVEVRLLVESSSTTNGVGLALNGSAAATYFSGRHEGHQSAGNFAIANSTAYDSGAGAGTVAATGTPYMYTFTAIIVNGGSSNTLSARILRAGTGGGTLTVRSGWIRAIPYD